MGKKEITRERLIKHYEAYPKLQITDIFKYIFQSALGCEHMVSSEGAAVKYIRREYASLEKADACLYERLDGAYSRVNLSAISQGLAPETLGKLFCRSAKTEPDGKEELLLKLQAAKELVYEGVLPFDSAEFEAQLSAWRDMGYPAIHHSDAFRCAYHPAYRVVANEYVKLLPLLLRLDTLLRDGTATIAIDGGSAGGKTTLAALLYDIYSCNVFHMDDFFLRPEQRSAERYAQIGGNIDRERFLKEVLEPLKSGGAVSYRRFDCASQTLGEPITAMPNRLTVIEGVYSMHPELVRYYDISVLLYVEQACQRERILKRNSPEFAPRFFNEWIPLENRYFAKTDIKNRCDICISAENEI